MKNTVFQFWPTTNQSHISRASTNYNSEVHGNITFCWFQMKICVPDFTAWLHLIPLYYKMRLRLLQNMAVFYYKMQQKLITKCIRFFISKYDSFITKCDSYYKMQRLLQNTLVKTLLSVDKKILSLLFLDFQ